VRHMHVTYIGEAAAQAGLAGTHAAVQVAVADGQHPGSERLGGKAAGASSGTKGITNLKS
jgi:hypothetical protein